MKEINIARSIYIGMAYLHMSKRDVLFMTPKELVLIWDECLKDHGQAVKREYGTIDDLP